MKEYFVGFGWVLPGCFRLRIDVKFFGVSNARKEQRHQRSGGHRERQGWIGLRPYCLGCWSPWVLESWVALGPWNDRVPQGKSEDS